MVKDIKFIHIPSVWAGLNMSMRGSVFYCLGYSTYYLRLESVYFSVNSRVANIQMSGLDTRADLMGLKKGAGIAKISVVIGLRTSDQVLY